MEGKHSCHKRCQRAKNPHLSAENFFLLVHIMQFSYFPHKSPLHYLCMVEERTQNRAQPASHHVTPLLSMQKNFLFIFFGRFSFWLDRNSGSGTICVDILNTTGNTISHYRIQCCICSVYKLGILNNWMYQNIAITGKIMIPNTSLMILFNVHVFLFHFPSIIHTIVLVMESENSREYTGSFYWEENRWSNFWRNVQVNWQLTINPSKKN
jgi:hypothetical protein